MAWKKHHHKAITPERKRRGIHRAFGGEEN